MSAGTMSSVINTPPIPQPLSTLARAERGWGIGGVLRQRHAPHHFESHPPRPGRQVLGDNPTPEFILMSRLGVACCFMTSLTTFEVRPATLRDAKAIAEIHAAADQAANKGLLSQESLPPIPIEKRQAYWREAIEFSEPQVQVALDDGKIVRSEERRV